MLILISFYTYFHDYYYYNYFYVFVCCKTCRSSFFRRNINWQFSTFIGHGSFILWKILLCYDQLELGEYCSEKWALEERRGDKTLFSIMLHGKGSSNSYDGNFKSFATKWKYCELKIENSKVTPVGCCLSYYVREINWIYTCCAWGTIIFLSQPIAIILLIFHVVIATLLGPLCSFLILIKCLIS